VGFFVPPGAFPPGQKYSAPSPHNYNHKVLQYFFIGTPIANYFKKPLIDSLSFMKNKGRILIADKNPEDLEELEKLFQEMGHEVLSAQKVAGVLHLVQSEKIDLVVLAVDMPEMPGYEVVPILKGMAPRLPVIITARENTSELEARVRQAPIFYYHVLSFGPEELALAVQNALERSSK
jgi:DNA-binding NtrC family response regulator